MMKRFAIPALALAAAAVAVPAAAQSLTVSVSSAPAYTQDYRGWQPISQRKYNLDRRIDQGVRTRQLSYREAGRLKAELNSLVRLEYSYHRGGLSQWERRDLDRRYDRLSRQVRSERNDWDNRRR